MSDITKCYGLNCPLAQNCYRYTADINSVWQDWMTERYEPETKECPLYIPDDEYWGLKESEDASKRTS